MTTIEIGDKTYKVREAHTEEEKEKGLQGVKELSEDEGMLFYFNPPQEVAMWMKDTLIPLDIIFIDEDMEVISVAKGEPNNEELIIEQDVAYVLELNQNSGIEEGDELDIEEAKDEDNKPPVMKVLAPDGSTQMDLWGGERIFSRKNTVILIRKAKKANLSKDDKDFKALGRYMFKCIKGQDERPPEYVDAPEQPKESEED